jgi:hypothetical protein
MTMRKTLDAKINSLTRLVEKGFAALADDLAHRPTNSSVAKIVENVMSPLLDEKLTPIVTELGSIRRDLKDLRAKVENVIEFRKEIDHALERIVALENISASRVRLPPSYGRPASLPRGPAHRERNRSERTT